MEAKNPTEMELTIFSTKFFFHHLDYQQNLAQITRNGRRSDVFFPTLRASPLSSIVEFLYFIFSCFLPSGGGRREEGGARRGEGGDTCLHTTQTGALLFMQISLNQNSTSLPDSSRRSTEQTQANSMGVASIRIISRILLSLSLLS